ncbi:VOC family protein [Nocardioides rotundus]|uniref:VOC family protein n=1 Tax=Nocardioides rotundus TaxID=1774216 RepID=UPI001CBEA87A|nr:VOC family protein [Nocardioides rotundus]UAL29320.1 VOC family protein [Nocardioides rotundus]
MTTPQLYSCLRFTDAERAIDFVSALGFAEVLVVRSPDDPAIIEHAQFRWRDNGGIMLGSERDGVGPTVGSGCVNLVVASDEDVDRVLAAALGAGGRQLNEPSHAPYGGRNVAVADPEGNVWNIDSYPGEE